MPIYEYQCPDCNYKFEDIQGFNDEPHKECPKCKKMKLQRLFGSPNFSFKGEGWTQPSERPPSKKDWHDLKDHVDYKNKGSE